MRALIVTIFVFVSAFLTAPTALSADARVAIIIDDIGNNRSDLNAALLPGNVTFAVLPFTPHARSFALRAHHQDKQIMLHAPMQAVRGNRLGPGALTTEMSSAEIKLELQRALDDVPYVVGVNNHMGSYFTQVESSMRAVLETLQYKQLYFIDSRTSEFSVAEQLAEELQVATNHRHVFLDNDVELTYLQQQWQQLIDQALATGEAIGIGHPYPETLAFLKQEIPKLEAQGITLVFASELAKPSKRPLSRRLLEASE